MPLLLGQTTRNFSVLGSVSLSFSSPMKAPRRRGYRIDRRAGDSVHRPADSVRQTYAHGPDAANPQNIPLVFLTSSTELPPFFPFPAFLGWSRRVKESRHRTFSSPLAAGEAWSGNLRFRTERKQTTRSSVPQDQIAPLFSSPEP